MQEPDPEARRHSYAIGSRVVIASMLFPLAWIVTGSVSMTMFVAGFSFFLLLELHPTYQQLAEEAPVFRMINKVFAGLVLMVFVLALARSVMMMR